MCFVYVQLSQLRTQQQQRAKVKDLEITLTFDKESCFAFFSLCRTKHISWDQSPVLWRLELNTHC